MKKISSTLSIAATVLLQACGNSASEPGSELSLVENTQAPALVGLWSAGCKTVSVTGTSTITGSSGGGVIQNGTAILERLDFKQDGRLEITTENFASTNCNANTSMNSSRQNLVYVIGADGIANDGSAVTGVDFSDSSTTVYSIFQLVNGSSLYLGDSSVSTASNDGASAVTRYDGLGPKLTKR